LLSASEIRFQRRSEWDGTSLIAGGVFLLDSIGELASLYEFADLAVVGGSLVPRGGHNILEAAQFGVPVLVGPHTENFRDIVQVFRRADALVIVTPESLTADVLRLLGDYDTRVALGQRAAAVMRQQQGATQRTVSALLELMSHRPVVRNQLMAGKPV
jgi:3-deoxy-D-manno-octulosonic-acid transferase